MQKIALIVVVIVSGILIFNYSGNLKKARVTEIFGDINEDMKLIIEYAGVAGMIYDQQKADQMLQEVSLLTCKSEFVDNCTFNNQGYVITISEKLFKPQVTVIVHPYIGEALYGFACGTQETATEEQKVLLPNNCKNTIQEARQEAGLDGPIW